MFINRKKYEELKKAQRKLEECEELIKLQNTQIYELTTENNKLEELNDTKTKYLYNLENDNTMLLQNEQKLINWIENILKEFGTMDVYDRRTVQIPVYKNPVRAVSGKMPEVMEMLSQEEIIIPEIRIIKMK